jgi:hypothetical protein
MRTRNMRGLGPFAAIALFALCAGSLWAQTSTASASETPPAVIDENLLFGGPTDIVTVIDPDTASAGTVQLVKDTKTYPVFLISGSAGAGLYGNYTPVGATSSDSQVLYGAVNLSGLEFDYLPTKNLHFSVSNDLLAVPNDILAASVTAYADLRQSDLVRLYAAGSFNYDPSNYLSTKEYDSGTFSLDELFVDTQINEKVFFRLGKQRISWGVGYWYKPSDVLSLSAIDPDDPTAARNGPFAFKIDVPMKLNHLMVYMVPPVSGLADSSSMAAKYDLVVNGWELSFAGYGRADLEARPRAIFTFTGAVGAFDVYGENVLLYGSDRTYVRESSTTPGTYETYSVEDAPFFQSTLGLKYSVSKSSGFSFSAHLQGYYNGTGYADATILQVPDARTAVKNSTTNTAKQTNDLTQTGQWYLAGSASISGRFGEGRSLTQVTGSAYALANFSDGSMRFNPQFEVAIGDQGGRATLTLSDLTAIGAENSEYAPKGNKTTPALTLGILNDAFELQTSVPITFNTDFSVKKVQTAFSVFWNAVQY